MRRGLVESDEFFKFYLEKKRWARTFMLVPEKLPDGLSFAGANNGGNGGGLVVGRRRVKSFVGVFDTERWCVYCGITRGEYESLERRLRDWRRGKSHTISEEIAEKVLTNLGRPDLYAVWFLDDEEQLNAA